MWIILTEWKLRVTRDTTRDKCENSPHLPPSPTIRRDSSSQPKKDVYGEREIYQSDNGAFSSFQLPALPARANQFQSRGLYIYAVCLNLFSLSLSFSLCKWPLLHYVSPSRDDPLVVIYTFVKKYIRVYEITDEGDCYFAKLGARRA